MRRAAATFAVALAAGVCGAAPASGYEFEVRALSIGQGYELRSLRPLSGSFTLRRRRFTQTLSLDILDIGEHRARRRLRTAAGAGGDRMELYFSGYLRIDHDFGEFVSGELAAGAVLQEVVDVIPELAPQALSLQLLYGFVGGRGIGGFVDFELGRQLVVDSLDWWSFDGLTVRAHTPWRVAVEAFGGLRVRDSSFLGSPVHEPDGTGGAACAEYVEGAVPGSGAWRPIDAPAPVADLESPDGLCPQREQAMPTFGAAVETERLPVHARVAYRRSVSRSPGLIGPADRFEHPDVGYYPDELGTAPGWGVNEEHVTASALATWRPRRGAARLTPYAAARYSLLHGLIDQAHAGARVQLGRHALAPEYYYSFPTFDGDSIFNVFSTSAYHDARLTYELEPVAAVRAYARGWLRRYRAEDAGLAAGVDEVELAAGGQVGARWRHGPFSYARLDLFHEGGYGGQRTGGHAFARWRVAADWDVAARASLIRFDEDLRDELDGTSFGAQLGARYRVNEGVAVQVVAEENVNRIHDSQFRIIGVLDLAFRPEL